MPLRIANVHTASRKKEEALGSLLWGLLQREKSRAGWPRVCHATHDCRQYLLNTWPAKKLHSLAGQFWNRVKNSLWPEVPILREWASSY